MLAIKRSCWQQKFPRFPRSDFRKMKIRFFLFDDDILNDDIFTIIASRSTSSFAFAPPLIDLNSHWVKATKEKLIRTESRPEKIDYYRQLNRRWLETIQWAMSKSLFSGKIEKEKALLLRTHEEPCCGEILLKATNFLFIFIHRNYWCKEIFFFNPQRFPRGNFSTYPFHPRTHVCWTFSPFLLAFATRSFKPEQR